MSCHASPIHEVSTPVVSMPPRPVFFLDVEAASLTHGRGSDVGWEASSISSRSDWAW